MKDIVLEVEIWERKHKYDLVGDGIWLYTDTFKSVEDLLVAWNSFKKEIRKYANRYTSI